MIRKLVTGIDANGKSVFLEDTQVSPMFPYPAFPGFGVAELFYTEQNPQPINVQEKKQVYSLELPAGAFRLCICHIPPLSSLIAGVRQAGTLIENENTFMMHKTQSIDYVYVIKGEVLLRLDSGDEQLLKPGNCVIQKGAMHTWHNLTTEPCEILGVMVGAIV